MHAVERAEVPKLLHNSSVNGVGAPDESRQSRQVDYGTPTSALPLQADKWFALSSH